MLHSFVIFALREQILMKEFHVFRYPVPAADRYPLGAGYVERHSIKFLFNLFARLIITLFA